MSLSIYLKYIFTKNIYQFTKNIYFNIILYIYIYHIFNGYLDTSRPTNITGVVTTSRQWAVAQGGSALGCDGAFGDLPVELHGGATLGHPTLSLAAGLWWHGLMCVYTVYGCKIVYYIYIYMYIIYILLLLLLLFIYIYILFIYIYIAIWYIYYIWICIYIYIY